MEYSIKTEDSKQEVVYQLLCMGCLCGGRTTKTLTDPALLKYYENILSSVQISLSGVPAPRLCWECEALLKRALHFTRQVRECFAILQPSLLLMGTEDLSACLSSGVCRVPRLQTCPVKTLAIPSVGLTSSDTEGFTPSDSGSPMKEGYCEVPLLTEIKKEYDKDPISFDIKEEVSDVSAEPQIGVNQTRDVEARTWTHSGKNEYHSFVYSEDSVVNQADTTPLQECVTPPDIENEAELVKETLLPEKSKQKYKSTYEKFAKWKIRRKSKSLSENVFLAYFSELSKTRKPSSLWSIYSILKTMVSMKHDLDIKDYRKLTLMLKKQSDGFECKRSKVFTGPNVETFIHEAPDSQYLAMKVALIFGLYGACRSIELRNITANDIVTHDDTTIVMLRDIKNKTDRTFVVRDTAFALVRKYQALRPDNLQTNSFFLNYRNSKCTAQVMGRHRLASVPKMIAAYLKLPTPEEYTGHCFRRTSAVLLSDYGANSMADVNLIERRRVLISRE